MTTIALTSHQLRAGLHNAMLGAHTDGTLPGLNCVRIRWGVDSINFAATDRYRIFFQEITKDLEIEGSPGEALIRLSDIKNWLSVLPKARAGFVQVSLEIDEDKLVVTNHTPPALAFKGDFPKIESLLDAEHPKTETPFIGLNPGYLADYAKVLNPDTGAKSKNAPLIMEISTDVRPVKLTIKGINGFRSLLMPIRISE